MCQKRVISTIFLFATLLGLAACSSNPVTGKQNLVLLSDQQEIALGAKQYQPLQQQQGGQYNADPQVSDYINKVGQKLAKVSDRPDLPYEFVVINNDVPNAWALPGGKIGINRGLLLELQDESQLAAVLAHEIVHAAARHSAQQMSRQQLVGIGVAAVGIAASQNSKYGSIATVGAVLGSQLLMAKYSRSHELESDAYGMKYMAAAGYDPMGAVELQETFVRLSEGQAQSPLATFFASHPPSQERVAANRAKARNLGGSMRNKAAFDQMLKTLRADKAAYDKYQQGVKALQDGDAAGALVQAQWATSRQPNETLFWQLRGRALLELERENQAIGAFNRAIVAQPALFSNYLLRGMVHKGTGNPSKAEEDLLKSRDLLPTQMASFLLGEIRLQAGDKARGRAYMQEAAAAGGELGEKAKTVLANLQ